jgi:hypothetical protein
MRYQPIIAKIAFGAFVLGLLIALAASFGTRLGYWDYALGVKILIPGVAIGAIGLIAGLVWIWRALAGNNSTGWRFGAAGLIGAVLVVGVPADSLWLSYSLPPIHDISTDISDAPKFDTLLDWRKGAPNPPDYDGPNLVSYGGERMTTALAQKYAYVDIKPMEFLAGRTSQKKFFAARFWHALNAVNALGWQVASFDLKSGRIEATDTSFWFGVVSDIVIRIRPAGSIGVRVDIRSKSRIGTSDMGRNAEIIRDFLPRMKG